MCLKNPQQPSPPPNDGYDDDDESDYDPEIPSGQNSHSRQSFHQQTFQQPNYTKPYNDNTLFRSLLGSLMYLAVQTRPDISFAVFRIAFYAHETLIQDYEALVNLEQSINHQDS